MSVRGLFETCGIDRGVGGMIKTLLNAVRLYLLNKLLRNLCDDKTCCRNCPSYLTEYSGDGCRCAQWHVIGQALEKWGIHNDTPKSN